MGSSAPFAQFACRCQKQPWTNRTTRRDGKIRSGLPGNDRACSLNRYPSRCRAERTILSGVVFRLRTRAMIALRSAGLNLSMPLYAASVSAALLTSISIFPKGFEPIRRQFCVSNGVLDVLVAQIVLHRARVLPVIRQLIAARMPQHMRMDREWKRPVLPYPGDHLPEAGRRDWCSSLREEYVAPLDLLALEPTKVTDLGTTHRVYARRAVLYTTHM